MNKIKVSILLLAIVQLEQYALQLDYYDFQQFSDEMLDVMNLVDKEYSVPFEMLAKIRTVTPFLNLSLDQERYVYSVFSQLK